ncbi:oligosaccharide flippase family protein [Alishewanella sp. 16-MA]|uniref:Oligosaccharide flippase family protein n=1 Tax=Alishewanella maricola TaxID=2795740 RepID=A0ABS8C314_9ALTE|nr:oligosaccharide flippase family protein [Alishewanella maricola]MCB5226718.1 oligosaccharide flippase family protein [Alishewanella maricola]
MLRSLFKNAVSMLAEKGAVIILTFITTPILLRELGAVDYGIWILLINMVAWARMSNLGFNSAVTRETAILIEKDKFYEINTLFNTSLFLHSILGLLGLTIVLLPVFFPTILNLPAESLSEASVILYFLGFKVFTDFLLMSSSSFFAANLKDNIQSNISTITEIVRGILSIFLVLHGYGMFGLLFALLITDLVSFIVKFVYLKKTLPVISLNVKLISLGCARGIISFSKYIILSNVALIIRQRIGVNIVSKYVGVGSVAFFNIAQQLVTHCENIISIISQVTSPAVNRILNSDKNVDESIYISLITRLNLFSTLVVFIPLFIFSEAFIVLWLGQEFIDIAIIIKILSFSLLGKFIYLSAQTFMIAKARHRILPVIHIFGAAITLFLSILFAIKYGLLGIAFSLAVSAIITELIFFTPIIKNALGHQFKLLLKIIGKIIFVTLMAFVLFYNFSNIINIESWSYFILYFIIFNIFSITFFWLIIFSKLERNLQVKSIFK